MLLPIGIVAVVLAIPQRVYQMKPDDLDVTVMGCLWRGVDTPSWCGPPVKMQGREQLRLLREHVKREVKTIKRSRSGV